MGFNINTIRLFIATLLLLIGQHTLAKTDIYASNGYYTSTVTWEKSKSPYILHVDVNIEKRGALIIEPGVEVVGNNKRIKVGGRLYVGYVESHKNDNPKNEKVTIKNTYLEAAGIGDRIMNLSHLNMTGGSITPSSGARILTKEFSLKESILTRANINSSFARGDILLSNNKFINSGFSSVDFGVNPDKWHELIAVSGSITINNNTFENNGSKVEIRNHKIKSITINNNVFKNNSNGVHINPHWSSEYGYVESPVIAEIKNNTFTRDSKGIETGQGKFNILDNKFN